MGTTKRRRSGGKKEAPAAVADSVESRSGEHSVFLLLQRLLSISENRAAETIQAVGDGKCYIDASKKAREQNVDGYWLLLSTYVVNRLIRLHQEGHAVIRTVDKNEQSHLLVVAALCDVMSQILLADKSKLEKASNGQAGRSIVARAMLTTTVASSYCLQQVDTALPLASMILEASVSALDRLVFLHWKAPKVDWNDMTAALQSACQGIAVTALESSCMENLATIESISGPPPATQTSSAASPPAKRAARGTTTSPRTRRKTNSTKKVLHSTKESAALLQAFESLTEGNYTRLESRVALKRWASMALVWFGQGQLELLKSVHKLATTGNTTNKRNTRGSQDLGPSSRSRLGNLIVSIVSEAGSNSGLRPPTGVMEQYLRSIVPCTSNNQGEKLTKTDIRDWATIAAHDLIQLHRQCLKLLASTKEVINDQADSSGDNVDGMLTFTAPNLSDILQALSRSASSSVSSSGYSAQAEWTKTMLSIAAAQCVKLAAQTELPLDCKLTEFALHHLSNCLEDLQGENLTEMDIGDDTSDCRDSALESHFQLSQPLPDPLGSAVPDAAANPLSLNLTSTFAGVWTLRSKFGSADAVSLVLRSLGTGGKDKASGGAVLLSVLTRIVRSLYDTRKEHSETVVATTVKAKGSRKRAAKGGDRRSKRRRTGDDKEPEMDDLYAKISPPRANTATEALNVLRFCMIVQPKPSSALCRSIRKELSTEHVKKILELGELLDKVMVKTRLRGVRANGPPNEATASSSVLNPDEESRRCHSNQFTSHEKALWSAHMTMCQAMGRGQASYDGITQSLFTDLERKAVVEAIIGGRGWPLALPAAYHAFLIANFTSDAIDDDASTAEQLLVRECIKGIGETLSSLDSIETQTRERGYFYLDHGILMSHRDSRTFLLALSRVPTHLARKHLEDLVSTISASLRSLQPTVSKAAPLVGNRNASSFMARVLVVCMTALDLVSLGDPFRELLVTNAGQALFQEPVFYAGTELYSCERCFMGLLGDWESPTIPAMATDAYFNMKEKTIKDLRSILERSFAIGFDTAQGDQCHLTFAAWNGLARLYKHVGSPRGRASDTPSLQSTADRFPKRILQIREDVCTIHREVNVVNEDNRNMSPAKLRSFLKNMLNKANVLVNRVVDTYLSNVESTQQEIPRSLFPLLASISTYVSASIAAHTKPGNDFFSTTLAKSSVRRNRAHGTSFDSEPAPSDIESLESDEGDDGSEVRVDTLSRLRECCDAFGAAPIHPDWLDVSCSFQEGIRSSDAVENAESAIRTLNQLLRVSLKCYKKHVFAALEASHKDTDDLKLRLDTCVNLSRWNSREGPNTRTQPSSGDRDWKEVVASFCRISQRHLDWVNSEEVVQNVETAKESWCPNAGQGLKGHLQDGSRLIGGWESSVAELRAGGEWELILAEALTISCLDVQSRPQPVDVNGGTHDVGVDEAMIRSSQIHLAEASMWRSVMVSALGHLVPASSLLRMGLNGVGRKPHPFSFHENNQDPYELVPISFSEALAPSDNPSASATKTTYQTICLLSTLTAEGEGAQMGVCHAIAANLLLDSSRFSDFESLQCIRAAFTGLWQARQSAVVNDKSLPLVVKNLIGVIEEHGRACERGTGSEVEQPDNFRRLQAFLSPTGVIAADTIVGSSVEVLEILASEEPNESTAAYGAEQYKWSDYGIRDDATAELVKVLCDMSNNAGQLSRACISMLLCGLLEMERAAPRVLPEPRSQSILLSTVSAFNQIEGENLKKFILTELCRQSSSDYSDRYAADLGSVLTFLLEIPLEPTGFKHARLVFDVIVKFFDESSPQPISSVHLSPILDVLMLYGCRFSSLQTLGTRIAAATSSNQGTTPNIGVSDMYILTKFSGFFRQLRDALDSTSSSSTRESVPAEMGPPTGGTDGGRLDSIVGRSCSFVRRSGYHGQHWYNCYTCGLVWEKGCCTLCALACHKDHDISYSRYSSFFCDCGAKDRSASEQNRAPCKCLSPLPAEEIERLFNAEKAGFLSCPPAHTRMSSPVVSKELDSTNEEIPLGVEIAACTFPSQAKASLLSFIHSADETGWISSLFRLLRQQFLSWKKSETSAPPIDVLVPEIEIPQDRVKCRVAHHVLSSALRARKAMPLELKRHTGNMLVQVRSAKGFQTQMSTDNAVTAELKNRLSKHSISRSVLAADARGRMVIAEPCSLVFVSCFSVVSLRNTNQPADAPLARSQIPILGSCAMKFNIAGLRLCPENDWHMLVWGTSQACVAILKRSWCGVEEVVEVSFDLDEYEGQSDVLLKCEWIPGSQSHVVLACGRCIRVYDIRRTRKGKAAQAVVSYNLGFEASLRDLSVIRNSVGAEDGIDSSSIGGVFKFFLLLESGRVHVVDLSIDSQGMVGSVCEQDFEHSESFPLSTAGVQLRVGASPGLPGASLRTFGEGSRLVYLKQSRILLYSCASSCVLAIMLDSRGEVEGTFEFLPPSMSAESLGECSGSNVIGPYTQWTELGVVYHDDGAYFRVACVGQHSLSNQSTLLSVDFNVNGVKVKELSGPGKGALASSSGETYEGLCAFSVPHIVPSLNARHTVGERSILCVAASTGSLSFLGESVIDMLPVEKAVETGDNLCRQVQVVSLSELATLKMQRPEFPITVFEKLRNVSDLDSVIFSSEGDGCDPEDLKGRLSRDNSSSLVCQDTEGCALTISIQQSDLRVGAGVLEVAEALPHSSIAIAAIRVLVGSTSNLVPSKIYVQGRPVDLTPGVKKWYSLPLTDEEVVQGIRNGMVTVGIGPAFDSASHPVVDAIEVYAAERKSIEPWLPTSFLPVESCNLPEHFMGCTSGKMELDGFKKPALKSLVSSARALSNLCELATPAELTTEGDLELLRQLVQDTVFEHSEELRGTVRTLVGVMVPEERSRQTFMDESMLFGISRTLARSQEVFDRSATIDRASSSTWSTLRIYILLSLNAASAISRERPMNYLQSIENAVDSKIATSSVAVQASKLILEGLRCSSYFEHFVSGVVELCLTEMAIAHSTERGKQFANFEVLSQFLEARNPVVAKKTCEAISSFCKYHREAEQGRREVPDLFTLLQRTRLVAYQCDSCSLCPLKEIRYTLLEDNYDIDLCKDCYHLGRKFAEDNACDSNCEVLISNRTVGTETKLTCAQIFQMQPVTLEKMDVEQVDVSPTGRHSGAKSTDSLGNTTSDDQRRVDPTAGSQALEDFISLLFSSMADLLATFLTNDRNITNASPLLDAFLDLVKHSKGADAEKNRARRLVKEITLGLSHYTLHQVERQPFPTNKLSNIATCCHYLRRVLLIQGDSHHEDYNRRQDIGACSQLVCETHGIPAVRRRCARGIHKDRRFYVCGKDRGERCKFFIWADEVENQSILKPSVWDYAETVLRGYLWQNQDPHGASLQGNLCKLLENEILKEGQDDSETSACIALGNRVEIRELASEVRLEEMELDLADGVYCSREKLRDVTSGTVEVRALKTRNRRAPLELLAPTDRGTALLEVILDVMVLVADHKSGGIARWFSLLCEISVTTSKPSSMRDVAKKVLRQLCGDNRVLYHSVRDHFAFSFQIRTVYKSCLTLLEAANDVRERAKRCCNDWKEMGKIDWPNVGVGDFVGTDELIAEDVLSPSNIKSIEKVLDELWSTVKDTGPSWRQFSGLQCLPHSYRESQQAPCHIGPTLEGQLAEMAPIIVLFWVATALTGATQTKAFRVIDLALTNWAEMDDQNACRSGRVVNDKERGSRDSNAFFNDTTSTPEEILWTGSHKLSIDDFAAFAMFFVHGGRTHDLRRVAFNIAVKLVSHLSKEQKGGLFQKLMCSLFMDVGVLGKSSTEYLGLLQSLAPSLEESEQIGEFAASVKDAFLLQMSYSKYDRMISDCILLEYPAGRTHVKKRFDLSECTHCLKTAHSPSAKLCSQKTHDRRQTGSGLLSVRGGVPQASAMRTTNGPSPQRGQKRWHVDQVCQFSRFRLDNLKKLSTSSEFSTFFVLKYRLAVAEISLSVTDPRGRFVKTITIYASPKPLCDSASIKSNGNARMWQRCATIHLPRGATKASAALTLPVAASNLKVEYSDFYERPGGSKAADGSLLVHCPRCTRVVTNAHGVCGNCGEVAFQCRKCRHINYDRLDAFLCVECGYCSSGSFSFDVIAGAATNAVAICNDREYERAIQILGAVSSLHSELKATLQEKGSTVAVKRKFLPPAAAADDFGESMRRALLGCAPALDEGVEKQASVLSQLDKPGSVVKFVANPESSNKAVRSSAAADRTRSLIRLARQIRSESGTNREGRRSGDAIVRQLGRGVSIDELEEDQGLIGILESGVEGISRASFHASTQLRSEDSLEDGSARISKSEFTREDMEEFQNLYGLMREAEREKYELTRRIEAWRRLDSGKIACFGSPITKWHRFSPSHCSACGGSVSFHLLTLWSRLFAARPSKVEVDVELLSLLMSDATASKPLSDCMKNTIQAIATKSTEGSRLVLRVLRERLTATKDVKSAEILGMILEVEGFHMAEEYTKLAVEVLANHRR